ncbi:sigma-70 family RNA polymerase sigma factor [Bacillus sp. JJ1562]|uniref:sigma-70 family RNA polymerase sigma factor n=1 Tax=Bacillus sp. JJ1562 TaxID=3122960 RepID=UPI00300376E1
MSYSTKLVELAIAGDKQAFEQLIKLEAEKLYKIAYLHMRNKEDALDVIQEATYKAYISIHQLNSPAFFSTWLVKILMRTAYNELARKKKLVQLPEEALEYLLESNQTTELNLSIDLSDALSSLNMNYRNAILLFYYYDLPIRTISTILNKPQATVKTYLRRAKAELRKTLGADYYGKGFI